MLLSGLHLSLSHDQHAYCALAFRKWLEQPVNITIFSIENALAKKNLRFIVTANKYYAYIFPLNIEFTSYYVCKIHHLHTSHATLNWRIEYEKRWENKKKTRFGTPEIPTRFVSSFLVLSTFDDDRRV